MIKKGISKRLGPRLVIASLIVGSVLSVFSTGLQLAASYARQRSDATLVLGRIETTLADSLEQAVWTFNFAQVEIILDGVYSDPNIGYVVLTTQTGHEWVRGTPQTSGLNREYDLRHLVGPGRMETVGTLNVVLSLDAINQRVWAEFWTTLLTNLGKAYLAALALLFLVHRMIIRHLRQIVDHVADNTPLNTKAALNLKRNTSYHSDDLGKIVDAVTSFENRTRNHMGELVTEVNERTNAEQKAREALSVRSRFLATMSHEIRTPLNAIMGFLHLIESHDGVPERPTTYAQTANRAAHQLLSLLNNTLDMSRLESNAIEITRRPTEIRALAEQWHQSAVADITFREKNLEVVLDVADTLPQEAHIDGPHVSQVVQNLIDNAIKFTDRGKIRIALYEEAASAPGHTPDFIIAVSDTGPGIKDEDRARIFERFVQADSGISRKHRGTGLGLSICVELAQLMDAELSLGTAERDGYSTTFLLRLKNPTWVDERHVAAK